MSRIQSHSAGRKPTSERINIRDTTRVLNEGLKKRGLDVVWTSDPHGGLKRKQQRSNLPTAPDYNEDA